MANRVTWTTYSNMCKLTCRRNGELLATKELVQLLQRSLKITLEKSVDFTRVVARKNCSV